MQYMLHSFPIIDIFLFTSVPSPDVVWTRTDERCFTEIGFFALAGGSVNSGNRMVD